MTSTRQFWKDEQGQAVTEHALLLSFLVGTSAVLVIGVIIVWLLFQALDAHCRTKKGRISSQFLLFDRKRRPDISPGNSSTALMRRGGQI